MTRHRLSIKYILLTHAHLDHITGVGRAKAALGVPVWLHQRRQLPLRARRAAGHDVRLPVEPQPPVDFFYEGEGPLRFGRYGCACTTRPGIVPAASASPSAVTARSTSTLFVGDTLFAGSIGRTDLPGGDSRRCCVNPRGALRFPDDTVVLSGHGEPTTIGQERRTNPFLT